MVKISIHIQCFKHFILDLMHFYNFNYKDDSLFYKEIGQLEITGMVVADLI